MKKVFISLLLLSGISGLTFSQQGGSQRGSAQSSQTQKSSSQQDKYSQGQGSSSMSQNPQWEKIGEKTVDLSTDKGIFNWNTDREKTVNANDVYSEIKFRSTDVPVDLTNVEVQYDNGQKQNLTVGSRLQANSDTKALTLNSKDKLDKITFSFNKNNAAEKAKAHIEVWGLKADSHSGMGKSSSSDHQKK